ncbi:hypothetical protein G6F57_006982 [Rhizopus arrhizus]|uniref:Fms interacting protein n=1 Tax=Rhizopus oryzae TaxID=64495 RepID=A0A9P7BSA2_RHIOR|nr:hypothetical protein G6F23_011419 [Rhizopus arrhizus]KAG1411796.1 hypothetical protein G6F58_008366 [Rhizopus delemar]KAG0758788.1 hypothetical protein G6F24_009543 [Rhizopus arrhizus]KAG0789769.1 hypothetical protein G6F21_006281 [Rhizopus arrhizus]KAG0793012.1 hypothetical protein G6F22_005713 [Rhizopus arrhizus]
MPNLNSISLINNVEAASKELETTLVKYMEKKLNGTLEDQYDFDEYEHVQQILDRLKDIQSTSYTSTRDSKQSTSDAKDYMDKKQVEMQDVMYEKRHILEEIVKCREFRSVYQDIELIPLEEFQSKAGPEYLVDFDNQHQLMINRLKYELVIRAELKEQQEALQQKKAQLIKENIKAQRKVDQFDKLLDDFVESTRPVIDALAAEEKATAIAVEAEQNGIVEKMDTSV